MAKVTHFEIPADAPERGMTFYGELLGWTFDHFGGMDYWLVQAGPDDEPGIHGAIMRREAPVEGEGMAAFVCTANVDDLDGTLKRVPELGGSVVLPKRPVFGVGWHAYVRDTEGNLFGLMQTDTNAA